MFALPYQTHQHLPRRSNFGHCDAHACQPHVTSQYGRDDNLSHGCNCSVPTVVDPAEQARERLIRAMREQEAARKAYADLVAERELAQLEQPYLPTPTFDFDHTATLRLREQQAALLREQQIAQHRAEIEAAARAKMEHELAIQAKKEELLRVHRLKQQQQQQAALRRQQELEAIRRQQELQALRQQQIAALHRQQQQQALERRRREEQREAASKQESEAVAQAIALALAFAQQFFPEQTKTDSPAQPHAAKAAEPESSTKPRVRFVQPSHAGPASAPTRKPVPVSVKPQPAPAGPSTSAAAAIRIAIRDSKGKASSHVRINSTPSASSSETSPADAIATLSILSHDLDGLVAPSQEWHSEAHRRHALNQLLEQIDAVQSGGDETVRDVRRALVRRVERAIEGLPDVEEKSFKPAAFHTDEAVQQHHAEVDVPALAISSAPSTSSDEVEGYDVPEYVDAASVIGETGISVVEPVAVDAVSQGEHELAAGPSDTVSIDEDAEEPVKNEWTTEDPVTTTANAALRFTVDSEVEVEHVAAEPALAVESTDADTDSPAPVVEEPEAATPIVSILKHDPNPPALGDAFELL